MPGGGGGRERVLAPAGSLMESRPHEKWVGGRMDHSFPLASQPRDGI